MKKILFCFLAIMLALAVALVAGMGIVRSMDGPAPVLAGIQLPAVDMTQPVNAIAVAILAAGAVLVGISTALLLTTSVSVSARARLTQASILHTYIHKLSERVQRFSLQWRGWLPPLIKPIVT